MARSKTVTIKLNRFLDKAQTIEARAEGGDESFMKWMSSSDQTRRDNCFHEYRRKKLCWLTPKNRNKHIPNDMIAWLNKLLCVSATKLSPSQPFGIVSILNVINFNRPSAYLSEGSPRKLFPNRALINFYFWYESNTLARVRETRVKIDVDKERSWQNFVSIQFPRLSLINVPLSEKMISNPPLNFRVT